MEIALRIIEEDVMVGGRASKFLFDERLDLMGISVFRRPTDRCEIIGDAGGKRDQREAGEERREQEWPRSAGDQHAPPGEGRSRCSVFVARWAENQGVLL